MAAAARGYVHPTLAQLPAFLDFYYNKPQRLGFHFRLKRLEEVCWHAVDDKTYQTSQFLFPFGSTFRRSILGITKWKSWSTKNRFVCRLLPAPQGEERAHLKLAPSGNSTRRERKTFWFSTFIRYCHRDCCQRIDSARWNNMRNVSLIALFAAAALIAKWETLSFLKTILKELRMITKSKGFVTNRSPRCFCSRSTT